MKTTITFALGWILMGCGWTVPVVLHDSDASPAIDDAQTMDRAVPNDAGACDACNCISVSPDRNGFQVQAPAPTMTGGAIPEGLYWGKYRAVYTGAGDGGTCCGVSVGGLGLDVHGTTMNFADDIKLVGQNVRSTATFWTKNEVLELAETCPSSVKLSVTYTVDSKNLYIAEPFGNETMITAYELQ